MKMNKINHMCLSGIKSLWSQPISASIIIFLALFCSLMVIFSFAEGAPIVDDHYFHFQYANLLRTEGWSAVENFDWIYLSGLAEGSGRYAVNLFQISLIPFTYMTDWIFALHMADAFYASVTVAIFYFIMRKEGVRNPLFFTFLIVGMISIFSRLLLGRAFVFMIGLVFLEVYFAIRKKYMPLLMTVLVHVLWHQTTYFLPPILIVLVEGSRYFVDKVIAWKNMAGVLGAVVIGMMCFPGFPRSLFTGLLGTQSIIQNGASVTEEIAGTASKSLAGNELSLVDFSAYTAGQGFAMVTLIFCLMAAVGLAYLYKKRDQSVYGVLNQVQMQWIVFLSAFVLAIIFGSFIITGRLYDFLFPAYVLLLAFVVSAMLRTNLIPEKSFSGKGFQIFVWSIVFVLCMNSFSYIKKEANSFDYEPSRIAAEWIAERSDDGEHVYLENWSMFTLFFFTNAHNTYSTGIEPLALKDYDEELYWKYYNIFFNKYYCEKAGDCYQELYDELMVERTDLKSRNEFKKNNSEKIINSIKNDFRAKFIVSDSRKLSKVILLSPELIKDYYEVQSFKHGGLGSYFTVFELM